MKRHYLYRILNRRAPPALDANRVWHVPWALDADGDAGGRAMLVGRHDFTTFRAAECQANSPIRTLDRLDVTRAGDEIRVEAAARSFLHHQVRSMVGTLELAGAGRWTAEEVREALEARDRARCGPMAPPSGLYLVGVDYLMLQAANACSAAAIARLRTSPSTTIVAATPRDAERHLGGEPLQPDHRPREAEREQPRRDWASPSRAAAEAPAPRAPVSPTTLIQLVTITNGT